MSRQAKKMIEIPENVTIALQEERGVEVKGPKGKNTFQLTEGIFLELFEGKTVLVKGEADLQKWAFLGLNRALLINAIEGVTKGFEKKLDLVGVGFRANIKENVLDMNIGFSHPSQIVIPEGIRVSVEKHTRIIVSGIDKQLVGQFAANVRAMRPPEPYKGKGIRYMDEVVRKKAGKTAK